MNLLDDGSCLEARLICWLVQWGKSHDIDSNTQRQRIERFA